MRSSPTREYVKYLLSAGVETHVYPSVTEFGNNSRAKYSYNTVGNKETTAFRLKTSSDGYFQFQNILKGDEGLEIFLLVFSNTTING